MKRAIEYLQGMLYAAKMGEMSVYENGDNPISNIDSKYLNEEGVISIEENDLLLIDDYTQERYGKTAQDVYDTLRDWDVISELNATPSEMKIVLTWLQGKGVIVSEGNIEYANSKNN